MRGGMETLPAESSTMAGARASISASMSRSALTCSAFNNSILSARRHGAFLGTGQFLISLLDVVLGEIFEITPASVLLLQRRQHQIFERLARFAVLALRRDEITQALQIVAEGFHVGGLP